MRRLCCRARVYCNLRRGCRLTFSRFCVGNQLSILSQGVSSCDKLRPMHDEEKPAGRIRWITHEGQQVLLVDLSYCSPENIESLVAQAVETIRSQPLGSVLVLADFTTVQFNPALFEKINCRIAWASWDRHWRCNRQNHAREWEQPSTFDRQELSRFSRVDSAQLIVLLITAGLSFLNWLAVRGNRPFPED